ncbi:hypothetical protein [Mucilaginibacter sp.]|uniref:hypothetical protein n=1 Tax=Mucilaginibacter sp. TaxID=1882438 RepID=UPI003B0088CD
MIEPLRMNKIGFEQLNKTATWFLLLLPGSILNQFEKLKNVTLQGSKEKPERKMNADDIAVISAVTDQKYTDKRSIVF